MIRLRPAISLGVAAILALALAGVGFGVERAVREVVVPQALVKAESVARSAAVLIARGLEAGVPVEKLVGVEDYFAGLSRSHGEVAGMALVGPDGRMLASHGEFPEDAQLVEVPVAAAGAPAATLRIAIDPDALAARIRGVLIDIGFIGLVALLIALELVALVVGTRGIALLGAIEAHVRALARGELGRHARVADAPALAALDQPLDALRRRHDGLRARAEAAGDLPAVRALDGLEARTGIRAEHAGENLAAEAVRPALFLFMLAEELTRPFLPRLTRALAPPEGPLGIDLLVSLPIVVFMAIVALCQLPFAAWSERLGRRRGFVLGALIAVAGYGGAALAESYGVFLAARSVAAVGFALVFVSAQGHVIDRSRPEQRAQGLATFVRAIMVAALCGPPIGGVIADRLGDQSAFVASAGLAALSALLALAFLPAAAPRPAASGSALAGLAGAVRAPGLLALIFGCAFPAKFLLAALCFFLLPVELARQGYNAADIGRLQMIYPVILVVGVQLFAALSDRLRAKAAFVALGGAVAGGGALLLAPVASDLWPMAAILALLGIGQAMSIAPQSALVADVAHSARAGAGGGAGVLGLFRLVERLGNAAGPAAAGLMLGTLGFSLALGGIGAMVVAGAAGFALARRYGASGEGVGARSAASPEPE
ncbi:MFS transporter [Ancylobacter terrae]|uniref:MFS transporter n=1 Tax=Ancylobacter sp. sgz301288 TaxID=3342077 RepID=UPI003859FBDA